MDFGWGIRQAENSAIFLTVCLFVTFGLCPLAWSADLVGLSLLGKPASQSSVWGGTMPLTADLAVDGDPTPDLFSFSCTHTQKEVHPWWKVDLEATHCLGKITLVNRADCCPDRLTGAVVRAGLNADFSQNTACGLPVTSAQASIHGGHLSFICDPPVTARYVSVDIPGPESGVCLTLCEVMVEEYQQKTNTRTSSCTFKLIYEGQCIKNPRPLATNLIKSLMACTFNCNRDAECWSFDYTPTTGRCRLYGEREEDLVPDYTELGCAVYAVVGCNVSTRGICTGSA